MKTKTKSCRTSVQNRRLHKLIAFLDALPPEKFDFSAEVRQCKTNGQICATVACAIGWTPKVFPRLVKWSWTNPSTTPSFYQFRLAGKTGGFGYRHVALELFGIPHEHDIFYPRCQSTAHEDLQDLPHNAKPQAVASMLKHYMILFP